MLKLCNATKKFNIRKSNELTVLSNVNLTVEDGEMTAIMGRSGAGKSTLLHILALLDSLTDGTFEIDGLNTKSLKEKQLAQLRNKKVGILLQDFDLVESENALTNVELPLYFSKCSVGKIKSQAIAALKKLGIDKLSMQKVSTLSGGQKQRVALARALVNNPSVLLCDEPTGALDSKTAEEIMDELISLNKDGMTILIVTHDEKVAKKCSRVIFIEDGKLSEKQIFENTAQTP